MNNFVQACTVAFLAASLGYAGQGLSSYIRVVERLTAVEIQMKVQDQKLDRVIDILVDHDGKTRSSK